MSGGTDETTLAPGSNVCSHSRPPVWLYYGQHWRVPVEFLQKLCRLVHISFTIHILVWLTWRGCCQNCFHRTVLHPHLLTSKPSWWPLPRTVSTTTINLSFLQGPAKIYLSLWFLLASMINIQLISCHQGYNCFLCSSRALTRLFWGSSIPH